MTEEQITKAILKWLQNEDWSIVCYDFPQSGTGRILHPNSDVCEDTKNKGGVIPDIVAVKNGVAVFFENKNRYIHSDFEKVEHLRNTNDYSQAIGSLLKDYKVETVLYGIGGPDNDGFENKAIESIGMVDFIVVTDGSDSKVFYNSNQVF